MDKTSAVGPQIIQVVGYKNTGKTTMTAALIAGFAAKGLKVAAIKHDGHDHFEMDQEGTDSYQFGKAGAAAVAVMSQNRTAIMKQHNTRLDDMLSQFSDHDWIVIEGFKDASYPKLVMVREAHDFTLIAQLQHVVGIVFWSPELMKEAEVVVGTGTDGDGDGDGDGDRDRDRDTTETETEVETWADRGTTGTLMEVENGAETKAGTRESGNRYDERNVREVAMKLNVRMEKGQDIGKRTMARFLSHEREAIVEAVLQLNSTEDNEQS